MPQMRVFLLLLLTGCTSRRLVLEEYRPNTSILRLRALEGRNVHVAVTASEQTMRRRARRDVPVEPPHPMYQFRPMTRSERHTWDEAMDLVWKDEDLYAPMFEGEPGRPSVGWVRIGTVHTGDVRTDREPSVFLRDTLQQELAFHGAQIVSADRAEILVQVNLEFFKVDRTLVYWSDLVVTYAITTADGVERGDLHTHRHRVSLWPFSSSYAYGKVVFDLEQQLMWHLVERIGNEAGRLPSAPLAIPAQSDEPDESDEPNEAGSPDGP